MEAHLAPNLPIQVNKIASSCEICSGPHDTQYCMENPEQAFVDYASTCIDEARESLKLGKNGSAFIQGKMPKKIKALVLFTLPCRLGDSKPFDTLADLGSCVNLIPLYLFKKLKIRLLEETDHVFRLANGTKSYPIRIVKNTVVHIGKLKLLEDFYVIDMEKDPATPLLVGKGFLATASTIIDYRKTEIAIGEGVTRSIFGVKEIDLGDEDVPYWTILRKRESYKLRPNMDGIGARPSIMLRKASWVTISLGSGKLLETLNLTHLWMFKFLERWVLRDLLLCRSLFNNSARLNNKFRGFYFIFKFGISGLLYQVVTTIADLEVDVDVDVILEDANKEVVVEKSADVEESADTQGRQAESQAQIYRIDLEHADKVLSMQDDEESETDELQEVVEVVTTAKLITEVVTAASARLTAATLQLTTAATPTLTTAPTKSKDKGKGILVEEPKPLKKQAQIEQDEAYARELEAELNKNIDWDEVIDHVQRKQKEDNAVKRYQALKRKPHTEAQARKNMMIYPINVAGSKMDYLH
nr:hypothetical protein [Tanacetum cinerariifolium]